MADSNKKVNVEDVPVILNQEDFVEILSYFEKEAYIHKNEKSEDWIPAALKNYLPDSSDEELLSFAKELKRCQKITTDERESLETAISNGRAKENWLASRFDSVASGASVGPIMAHQYFQHLNNTLGEANRAMSKTVLRKTGDVNMNPNLHGFIFEQAHVQTYNMSKAARLETDFSARVPDSPHGYTHHGVDIAIDDLSSGQKMTHKYNAKDYKEAYATNQAVHADGGHPGQTALVPDGQESKIPGAVNKIGGESEGACSNPMTYERSVELREQAQSGNFDQMLEWNEYQMRDLSIGIAKNAACAGILGAGMSAGVEIVSKIANGEQIEAEDVVLAAAKGGSSAALFDATSCAIKVGVEKDMIPLIPKGTSVATIANVAFVVVEDVKVLSQIADGELTLKEGLDALEATTISSVAGLAVAEGVGAAVGTAIGGPIGTVAGAVVGAVAYTAVSAVTKAVVTGAQMVRDVACEAVCAVAEGVGNFVGAACDFVSDVWDTVTGGCYITTAICKISNLSDDCFELTALRKYRDGWLMNQPDGPALVKEYYATAPGIVSFIDGLANKDEIYRKLRSRYLDRCLECIEKKLYIDCKKIYIEMVRHLEAFVFCCRLLRN